MLLLTAIPRLQLWTETATSHSLSSLLKTPGYVYVLVLSIAMCGGCLHGIAMAIRKKYGEGIEKYWLEWKWWAGTILDGFAGFMIWPAMPYVSVQIFAPLIIVIQLGTSYILGLFVFGEKCIMRHNIGVASAAIGVIGISLSTSHEASEFSIDDFFAGWVTTRFIVTNLVLAAGLAIAFPLLHRSTFWALLAAACEGIQYICSRSIVDSIFDHMHEFVNKPAVYAAFIIKFMCIVGIIHFQQLGLESDLSRFAGIYLVGCTLFTCIEGAAYFGDEMPQTIAFHAAAFCTLAGIWLLNQRDEVEEPDGKSAQDVEGNPQDAIASER